ncbi:MAG: hypothetical protein KTR21_07930 [Rhodobacteraceae bacterium]|nr:hypothetical protein [Paracoccaceae bacterium]
MALIEDFRFNDIPTPSGAPVGAALSAPLPSLAEVGPMVPVCLQCDGRPPLSFVGAVALSVSTEGMAVRHRLSIYTTPDHGRVAHLAAVFGAGDDARRYSNAVELAPGEGLEPLWRRYDPAQMVPRPQFQAPTSHRDDLSHAERDDLSAYLVAQTAVCDDLAALRADPHLRWI